MKEKGIFVHIVKSKTEEDLCADGDVATNMSGPSAMLILLWLVLLTVRVKTHIPTDNVTKQKIKSFGVTKHYKP